MQPTLKITKHYKNTQEPQPQLVTVTPVRKGRVKVAKVNTPYTVSRAPQRAVMEYRALPKPPPSARVTRGGTQTITRPIPPATSTTTVSNPPLTRISRTEMCGEVFMDVDKVAFHDRYINPANNELFPWLSRLASNYDMYSFERLVFRYVPACGTTTVGQLVMAIDYDPTDNNVGIGQADMVAMSGSVTSQLYSPMSCAMKRASLAVSTHKFYVSSDDEYNSDSRLNHIGRFLTYVVADPTVKTVYGQLFVDYTITFHNPQTAGPGYSNQGTIRNTTGTTNTDPVGTVVNSTLTSTKPDTKATPEKTKRIVKIIDGVVQVIGKVAPYITFIAKLFLLDVCPNMPGTYKNHLGVDTPIEYTEVPGETAIVVHSSQCRSGTVLCHCQGTYITLVSGSRPVITMAHSTNLTLKTIVAYPWQWSDTLILPATPVGQFVTAIVEFDFNDLTVDVAWIKPVITQSLSADMPVWNGTLGYINFYTKADV